jgi:chorismate mutase
MSLPNESAARVEPTEEADTERIAALRSNLDRINAQLLELIEARGVLVHEIMDIKERLGWPAHDPDREQGMLNALLRHAADVYPKAALKEVFGAIFAASRALANHKRRR